MSFEKRKLKWPRREYLGPLAKPSPKKVLGLNEKQLFKLGQKVGAAAIKEIMKRKRIPSRRPETAKQDREYNARVKVWLIGKYCRVCNVKFGRVSTPATNVHHLHGRGWHRELMMVESLWVPCCSGCHPGWIDSHREEARGLGLLCPKGQYNELPPDLK